MEKDDRLYFGHMLDTANKVVGKVQNASREEYDADENLRLALAHLIQVIGEAAGRVSIASRQQHPEIPWRAIIGMRHRIVHGYMEVDVDTVWEVALHDLPELLPALRSLVAPD